ncbi:MAG: DUF2085 domain-containing protein [Chloroflexota bacterium]|nr:DUF2085 domain-containing protein [Chloroflexota bacterium]
MAQRQQALTPAKSKQLWILTLWAVGYLGALAALVLLPGGSLLERLRWLDSGICAQLPTHSFYPGGERLPLCARNTGIYLGFSITLLTLYITGRGRTQLLPPRPIVIALACGVLALAIDGVNSFFVDLGLPHLYQPHNLLRLATGLLTGLAMGALVLPLLNRQFWRDYNEQRSITSWKAYLLLLPAMLLSFLAVASQSVVVLYPIALLSTVGVLIALTSVNLIAAVAVGKRDQAFGRYREIVPFFSLALVFAIGELLLLAQLKLALLGVLGL